MCIAWLRDGRAGHENQARGLLQALAARCPCQWRDWRTGSEPLGRWLRREGPFHLALAAGSSTHLPLARAALHGLRTVLLMRPPFPYGLARRFYHRMIVPRHDDPPPRPEVLATHGAINAIRPGAVRPGTGLVLLGGPSAHVHWDDEYQVRQVQTLLQRDPQRHWRLADSPRTPVITRRALARLAGERVHYCPWDDGPPGWLARTLPEQERVWVSADSVSMVYEALSTTAQVGLLPVDWRKASRLASGLEVLVEQGWVLPLPRWLAGEVFAERPVLAEADRAAHWLLVSGLLPEWASCG